MANFPGIASPTAAAADLTTALGKTPSPALSNRHAFPLGAWLSTYIGLPGTPSCEPCTSAQRISSDAAKFDGRGFGGDGTPWSIGKPALDRSG